MRKATLGALVVFLFAAVAVAQIRVKPAPDGEPSVVAQRVIHANFDREECPLVVEARRFGDGSITALCNNGARFRVFNVAQIGDVAMNCRAAEELGVAGC